MYRHLSSGKKWSEMVVRELPSKRRRDRTTRRALVVDVVVGWGTGRPDWHVVDWALVRCPRDERLHALGRTSLTLNVSSYEAWHLRKLSSMCVCEFSKYYVYIC